MMRTVNAFGVRAFACRHTRCLLFTALYFFSFQSARAQGPYAPAVGQTGTTAIHKDSTALVEWAVQCWVQRGWQDIADKSLGFVSAGTESSAVGMANGQTVSLGDSGVAVVKFANPVYNHVGWDFAVFENAFDDGFLELAFVEVSADSTTWYRFPAHSLTQTDTPVGSFGSVNATEINNLAGKYRAQYGTPFDIQEIEAEYAVTLPSITYIRLIDAIGTIDPAHASYDTAGNKVNEIYPTPFPSGGFDLDAVAIVNTSLSVSVTQYEQEIHLFPNPVRDVLTINTSQPLRFTITDFSGRVVLESLEASAHHQFDFQYLPAGMYFLFAEGQSQPQKIIRN